MNDEALRERIEQYTWYHSIQVTDRVKTPGDERHRPSQENTLPLLRSLDLQGKRVLDIGCRDGLFSFEAERMGAREVIGIDNDLSRGAVEVLIPYLNSRVQMHEMNMLDLTPETFGRFDVVLFLGILYHLRYPIWSLKLVRDVMTDDGTLLIETAMSLDYEDRALLWCPIGDESPYEHSSVTFFNLKGLRDTLYTLGIAMDQVQWQNPSLRGLKGGFAGIASSKPRFDRAAFLCHRFIPGADDLERFWEGTHRFHSG